MLNGSLPWSDDFEGLDSADLILSAKQHFNLNVTEIPKEFALFFNHVQSLRYTETMPDYHYLRTLFSDLFVASKFLNDSIFDWEFLDRQNELPSDVILIL
jgi:hypothetical protein